jgi:hypothetical protein
MQGTLKRLSLSVMVSSMFSLTTIAPPRSPQTRKLDPVLWNKLLSFENQELEKLDPSSYKGLLSLLKQIAPEWKQSAPVLQLPDAKPPFHNLRYFWKLQNHESVARYLLIGADGLFVIPGDSRAEAFIFDENGRLLSYVEFSIGWRAQFTGVQLIGHGIKGMDTVSLGVPLIKITTSTVGPGPTQYYAIAGDDLALVRLEHGSAIRNRFVAPNWIIGPPVPVRIAEEWEGSLRSGDPVEVLRSLVWLGGKHRDLNIPTQDIGGYIDPPPDVRRNAELVTTVRRRPGVEQRLEELRRSENKWISEEAQLALNPKDGDTSFPER